MHLGWDGRHSGTIEAADDAKTASRPRNSSCELDADS